MTGEPEDYTPRHPIQNMGVLTPYPRDNRDWFISRDNFSHYRYSL